MALAVRIASGGTTYRLQAESIRIMYDKQPIQAPTPAAQPIIYDLGFYRPRILISGIAGDQSSSEGGVTVPSKAQLETAVQNWYSSDVTVSYVDTVGATVSYVGRFASLALELPAGREENWDFTLTFVLGRSS